MSSSTANISHTRNSAPRLPISARPWTRAQRTLDLHGITQRDIADDAGLPLATVNRALSIRFCAHTSYASVLRMRISVERLLAAQHAPQQNLWADYDTAIIEGAAA